MIKKEDPFSRGGWQEIWHTAYPLILVNASNLIMQFIDRKFLSTVSIKDISAAYSSGALSFTLFSVFTATIGFSTSIISQYYGRKKYAACSSVVWSSFYVALVAGLICSYAMPQLGNYIVYIGNNDPDLLSKQIDFFTTIMPSGGFLCITIAFCSFFSGRERTLIVALVTLAACVSCIILDYIFIFGNWGSPAMGIVGAGLATTLSQAFGALIGFIVFIFQNQKVYPTKKILLINLNDIKRIIKFGIPVGIQSVIGMASFTSIIFLIGALGDVAVAATAIASTIDYIAFLPLIGMSQATSIVVAKHIGMKRVDVSEKLANVALKMSLAYIFLTSIFLIGFPDFFIKMFRPENDISNFLEVIRYTRAILICAAFYNFFDAIYFVYSGVLIGAGDTKFMMYLSLFFNCLVWVPGVAVCIFIMKLNVVGVWIFMAIYIAMSGVVLFFRFKTGIWKKIKLIETDIRLK